MTLRRLFIPILLLTVTNLYSQNHLKDYTYKISDSCWRIDYYMPLGPLSRMESYKDKKKTIAHGRFAFFDERGWTDSTGFFADGLRDGTWYYYANNGKLYLSREYSEGKVVSEKYEEPKDKKDEPLKDGEKESEFAGGSRGWQRYLNQNLRYPVEAIKRRFQGEVRTAFFVDVEGAVQDIWVFKSVERSLDKESVRLLEQSPKWTPAVQNGRKVKSYKVQPIVYRVQ